MNYWLLLSTIIFFGILGGIINAIRTNKENNSYWKSLIKGVVASFLVPVFLEIIKSDLGRNLNSELYDYIIFGGLCLIAAIFSDKFIDTIGEKILKKAEEAEKKAEESNKKVDSVIERRAEPEVGQEPIEKRILNFNDFNETLTQGNIQKVVDSLKSGIYEYRTVSGITKDTGLSTQVVGKILKGLLDKGLVTNINAGKRTLWALNK